MREFFDRKVEGYDDVHAKFEKTKALLTSVLPEDTERVLDLGAGTGMELIPLFKRFPRAKVRAVDISALMLEALAKRDFADRCEIICGDFFEAELGAQMDAAISTSALHHFDEDEKLVLYKRIYDCLKPGGIFANSDKTVPTQELQDEWLGYWENRPNMMAHIDTPLTPENEKKLLLAAGFKTVESTPTDTDNYRLFVAIK